MTSTQTTAAPPIRDERGVTLIEMLTGLLLFGMVAAILYSFLFMGLSMYKRVSVETQLRNQADALYSRIIAELGDAIYVKQASDGNDREIVYVKRNLDPEIYVDRYRMTMDERGLSVYDGLEQLVMRKELTAQFALDLSKSRIAADNYQRVDISLEFVRADADAISRAENSTISIHSKIPLFRTE